MKFLATIKHALGMATAVVAPTLTQAIATVAQTGNPIGDAAFKAVIAAESTTDDGATKKANVKAAVIPVAAAELAKGNVSTIVSDVEIFVELVIEAVVAQVKPSGAMLIALQLLKLFGVK